MSNANRPCHTMIDADENLLDHLWLAGDRRECGACGWGVCTAPGCENYVADAGTRCAECVDCTDDTSGVPVAVDDDDTSAVLTVRTAYEPIGAEGLGDVRARRAAFVAGMLCDCGGRLAGKGATADYVCIRCGGTMPARRVFLALNTKITH